MGWAEWMGAAFWDGFWEKFLYGKGCAVLERAAQGSGCIAIPGGLQGVWRCRA